jgi:hypothetical protein
MSRVQFFRCDKMGHYKHFCQSQQEVEQDGTCRAIRGDDGVRVPVRLADLLWGQQPGVRPQQARQLGCWLRGKSAYAKKVVLAQHVLPTRKKVTMMNGTVVAARKVCLTNLKTQSKATEVTITLLDVMLVLEAPYKLLSQVERIIVASRYCPRCLRLPQEQDSCCTRRAGWRSHNMINGTTDYDYPVW